MTRSKRLSRDLTALIAITVAVLLPLMVYIVLNNRKTDKPTTNNNAKVAFVQQCATDNETRTAVKHVVDKLAQRSKISTKANNAAPNQTPAQRAATAKSLQIINDLQDYAHGQLTPKKCTYPATTTTTTQRRPKGISWVIPAASVQSDTVMTPACTAVLALTAVYRCLPGRSK